MNLRAGDLDGIGLGLLDGWARAHAVVTILTEHYSANGLFLQSGEVDPSLKTFLSAVGSTRLQLQRLSEHLSRAGAHQDALADYIEAEYGQDDGG
jgi:hypothetical protein